MVTEFELENNYHQIKTAVIIAIFLGLATSVFFLEIEKVYQSKDSFYSNGEDKWGIDESYSSKKMRAFKNRNLIKSLGHFGMLVNRRIDCNRNKEPNYDVDLMKNGHYSEIHLCRPYTNHINYIDTLIKQIPKY